MRLVESNPNPHLPSSLNPLPLALVEILDTVAGRLLPPSADRPTRPEGLVSRSLRAGRSSRLPTRGHFDRTPVPWTSPTVCMPTKGIRRANQTQQTWVD